MYKGNLHIEQELLLKIAEGDAKSFRALYNLCSPKVYGFALRIVKSTDLAEEVVQEVFIKLWLNRELLAGVDNFGAYLRIISRNHTLTLLKRIATEQKAVSKIAIAGLNHAVDDEIAYKERTALLHQALQSLPPQQRLVYNLYHVDGLNKDEVAHQLNISPLTVKAHLQQAVGKVRSFMRARMYHVDLIILVSTIFFQKNNKYNIFLLNKV